MTSLTTVPAVSGHAAQATRSISNALRQTGRAGIVVLAALAAVVALASVADAAQGPDTRASAEQQMLDLINEARRAQGLGGLVVNVHLTRLARDWSTEMRKTNNLQHRSSSQLTSLVPSDWRRLGENIGRTRQSGASDGELIGRLHSAFMDSSGHRANILGDYNQVGIGVRVGSDGTMWITINFMLANGRPSQGPVNEGARLSNQVFADANASGRTADYAVLARADVFADALGGSGLAANVAPILFTPGPTGEDPDPALHPRTRAEIDRVLGGRGRVYLLGGTAALSPRAAKELAADGYDVQRLHGSGRVETSVRVAEEIVRVHGSPDEILVVRADQWPDAVSGGAYAAATRNPVVLTPSHELHPEVARFLARHGKAKPYALGGNSALSQSVVDAAGATRIAGAERTATAVAVVEQLWGRTTARDGDRFSTAPGWGEEAWSYALALGPWAAANNGPQLLVADDVPKVVREYLQRLGYINGIKGDVFSASSVPVAVQEDLKRLVGG